LLAWLSGYLGQPISEPPNEDNTKRLMKINKKRGWSDMLDSFDCMHCFFGLSGTLNDINVLQRWCEQMKTARKTLQENYHARVTPLQSAHGVSIKDARGRHRRSWYLEEQHLKIEILLD
jgi:hypothetical protein